MKDKLFVSAVILCAGSGERMGRVSKPLIKLGDRTVFETVLSVFNDCETINEIIVVCGSDIDTYKEKATSYNKKPIKFVKGGKTRMLSVFNGFKAVSANSQFIAIHDCARPFVTVQNVNDVVNAAFETGAACACTAVTDTIKYYNSDNGTVYTPERKYLLSLQTPQVFSNDVYQIAAALALKEDGTPTDDTTIVERAGFKVKYVECGSRNIKLTVPDDIILAKAIILLENKKAAEAKKHTD